MLTSAICLSLLVSSSFAWLPGSSPFLSPNDTTSTLPRVNTTDPQTRYTSNFPKNCTSPPWANGTFLHPSWPNPTNTPWKMRGVNLGSQFIIEPWMANDEFNSMGCGNQPDEWSCVQALGQSNADAVFATHWNTWITQEDVLEIASFGLNTVRIPVGFWIKEDLVQANESFPRGALPYLDRLVSWCADAGLYVIMDLHAGPGGQAVNQQFTGHVVDTPGWFTPFNYERTLQFLEWMTERIHTIPAYKSVGMLEVMNEPAQSWQYPEHAQDMLMNYYPQASARIRAREQSLGVVPWRQLHVQYMSTAWGSGDPTTYLKWDASVTPTKDGYLQAACNDDRGDVVVGEWSIAVADDVSSSPGFSIADAASSQIEWYQKYWATQVMAYEKSVGWVFWTWKCSWIGGGDDWRWCYQSAVRAGVVPRDVTQAASIAESACSAVSSGSGSTAGFNSTGSLTTKLVRREGRHLARHRLREKW